MRSTLKCSVCKQSFDRNTIVQYTPIFNKIAKNYCPDCLKLRQEQDRFAMTVCKIFQLEFPTPRIWKNRSDLQKKYGYTDKVITDCLEYLYFVEKKTVLSESLTLVTPTTVDAMIRYKNRQQVQGQSIARSTTTSYTKKIVNMEAEKPQKVQDFNPDHWLGGE